MEEVKFFYKINQNMGCSDSKLDTYQGKIYLSVIDPTFLKAANSKLRTKLKDQGIALTTYMSVECFISDQKASYSNNVAVRLQELQQLLKSLNDIQSNPNVLVIDCPKADESFQKSERITYLQCYDQLLEQLKQPQRNNTIKKDRIFVDVRILKEGKGENQPQLFILQQTLKLKEISYKIYDNFKDLQEQVNIIESPVVVTDYIFQKQVVTLFRNKKVRLICYCDLDENQIYLPQISFLTNNFQEIVNQLSILKSFKVPPLSTTKIFMCSSEKKFVKYKSTFEEFNLKVRVYKHVKEILKVTKYYFSLVIVCPEEQKAEVEKEIAAEGLSFRVQVVGIIQDTENSARGLRKILREAKRGYLAEKGTCKMIDIIDKYHNSSKFQEIKKQLAKNQIGFRCYSDCSSYFKNEVYCAPLIICDFKEREQLASYLHQVESKSKIVIFCNKNQLSSAKAENKKWAYASNHFGKIIQYIKLNKILVPVILDHNQKRIQQKQLKIKNKQHRISALKWSDPNLGNKPSPTGTNFKTEAKEPQVSFIIPKLDINPLEVKEIAHDASALLKMPYSPVQEYQKFKKDLTISLIFLKDRYKISFPQKEFNDLLQSIHTRNLQSLALRTRQFLGSEKQMGLKINDSLRRLQSLQEKELKHLREIIFLMNLNFIGYYQMPRITTVKLVHWTRQTLLQQCLPDGVVIFKNFLVMYEEGTIEPIPGCLKLELELQFNTLNSVDLPISTFFSFEGRYVFAPYTQFKVQILPGQNQSVAGLQLVKKPDFLSYYFQENLSSSLPDYFAQQMTTSSPLIDPDSHSKVRAQIQRCSILKRYRTACFQEAVNLQNQLLAQQEEVQDIDNRYINQLLYELAFYQFKSNQIDDLLLTVEQISNNDPIPFIQKECSNLLSKAGKELSKANAIQNPIEIHYTTQRTQKCIQLKQTIAKLKEGEQSEEEQSSKLGDYEQGQNIEQNIFEHEKCLQVEDNFGDFEYFQ